MALMTTKRVVYRADADRSMETAFAKDEQHHEPRVQIRLVWGIRLTTDVHAGGEGRLEHKVVGAVGTQNRAGQLDADNINSGECIKRPTGAECNPAGLDSATPGQLDRSPQDYHTHPTQRDAGAHELALCLQGHPGLCSTLVGPGRTPTVPHLHSTTRTSQREDHLVSDNQALEQATLDKTEPTIAKNQSISS